jgi:hypothetical protein
MQGRRLLSSLTGGLLLVGTAIEACSQGYWFHEEHYVWPKEKYGILTPLRWQDIVFFSIFWIVTVALLYLAHRLLTYGLRRKRGEPALGLGPDGTLRTDEKTGDRPEVSRFSG